MWTSPLYRRQGLAARVLDFLEVEAAAAGYRRLVLETGPEQPEAAAMYERRGYGRIPVFGPYPQALAFETRLDRAETRESSATARGAAPAAGGS